MGGGDTEPDDSFGYGRKRIPCPVCIESMSLRNMQSVTIAWKRRVVTTI
jgi:hypothetical protein